MNNFRSKREENIDNKPTRFFSSRQENCVAKAIGGIKTPNSGATTFKPGDIVTDKFLIECKTCTKEQKSFSIKKEWFDKNKDESLLANKEYSAVVFNFGPDTENHYIIDEYLFKLLLESLENK